MIFSGMFVKKFKKRKQISKEELQSKSIAYLLIYRGECERIKCSRLMCKNK